MAISDDTEEATSHVPGQTEGNGESEPLPVSGDGHLKAPAVEKPIPCMVSDAAERGSEGAAVAR